ncbi:MAG: hypothetical protein ACOYNY_15410 [Caldilineaceae bacterium]|jgi:hypothetical protein
MAYSDFDLKTVRERFTLIVNEETNLFTGVEAVAVSTWLRDFLDEWGNAALAMNTEKARSEMIIAPILMEAVRSTEQVVRLFSGVTFDIDRERGLNGACDYLLSRSPERFFPGKPVVAVVEAKREDITGGLGQCLAEMVAAHLYNETEGNEPITIYGAVTTGNIWRFLQLQYPHAFIDQPEYYLPQVGKILGILRQMTQG